MKDKVVIVVEAEVIQNLIAKIEELQKTVERIEVSNQKNNEPSVNENVLYNSDICQLFGINNDRISAWINQGRLHKINPAGTKKNMFNKEEVMALLESVKNKSTCEPKVRVRKKNRINKYGILMLK